MQSPNELLTRIETAHLWAYFHKDWLLQIRSLLRPQLPSQYFIFVESETILISPDAAGSPAALLPDDSVSRPRFEIFCQYTLLIRRTPENQVVAVLEMLSPTNKGISNRFDKEKHLRKRASLFEAGVNLLEIDALLDGDRILPATLNDLAQFARNAWTAFHLDGRRKLRGWGWNDAEPLPVVPWTVEGDVGVLVDLALALQQACDFNRWDELVASAEG